MSVSYKRITGNGAADYYLNCSDTPTKTRAPAETPVKPPPPKLGYQTHIHRVVFELFGGVAAKEEKRVRK